jgi:hypothetical protein
MCIMTPIREKMQETSQCQISECTAENLGTYQLNGWLTPCNYMSYEMTEYNIIQFLRILQDLLYRGKNAQYHTQGKRKPFQLLK